jgi:uncharacterized membrane protein (UPF0127 family)
MNSSPLSRNLFRLAVVILNLLVLNTGVSACASQKLETAVLSIARADSTPVEITVEIARTEEERSQGLMHRKKLPDGEGMIFVFDRDQQLSFWMKNTVIPLSIAFIASDGRIIEIRDMRPLDLSAIQSSRSVRYALEAPQGWFDRAGIKPGDVVNLDF